VVLVVANTSSTRQRVKIQYNGQFADVTLPAGAVGTYAWTL
jgi:hypothetical protein